MFAKISKISKLVISKLLRGDISFIFFLGTTAKKYLIKKQIRIQKQSYKQYNIGCLF